ncbi:ribosomal RNA-processing protein 7 homolog A-like [Glandiceps talaboti]
MAASISTDNISGFRVMPVKVKAKSEVVRYFYFKEHRVKEKSPNKPEKRTLFVINIPPYCNEECLQRLFSCCGKVEHVLFQQREGHTDSSSDKETSKYFQTGNQIKGYKVAYVIFENEKSLQKAKTIKFTEPMCLSTNKNPILSGMKKWCKDYHDSIPDVNELQKEIDEYMAEYDKKKLQEEEEEAEAEGVADEDGWVTVTRKGRNPGTARTELNQQKAIKKEKKQKEKQELMNFYRFQYRESRREHIANLRQMFEEDKQKIASMKSARKFKPY